MVKLGVTVLLGAGESATSFASRLAAVNRKDNVRLFCADMDISFKNVVWGDRPTLQRLADLGGADPQLLEANAFRRLDDKHWALNGVGMIGHTSRRPEGSFCLDCLEEDALGGRLDVGGHARVVWSLYSVRTCPKHALPLVSLLESPRSAHKHDTALMLRRYSSELPALRAALQPRSASPFEYYVIDRLAGRLTVPWLDGFPFSAATRACEMFGAVALYGPRANVDSFNEDLWAAAGAAGFEILSRGRDATWTFLDGLVSNQKRIRRRAAPHALGRIFGWLNGLHAPEYELWRDFIREFASSRYAYKPGHVLLGKAITSRVLHTVRTAAEEFGMDAPTLGRDLEVLGVIAAPTDPADREKVTFDANTHRRLLERLARSIDFRAVSAKLGLTRKQTEYVVAAGVLKPIVERGWAHRRFDPTDVEGLLQMVRGSAPIVDDIPPGVLAFPELVRVHHLPISKLVLLMAAGKLAASARLRRATGFAGLLMDPERAKRARTARWVGSTDSLKCLADDVVTVENARRRIGVTLSTMNWLITNGYIAVIETDRPLSRSKRVIEVAELDRFCRTYVTLGQLARDRSLCQTTVRRDLKLAGIDTIPHGQAMGICVYHRSDLPWSDKRLVQPRP